MSEPNDLPALDSRLALRHKEAAAALGISERKLRQVASRLPSVWLDGVRLYPVEGLRRWLDKEAERQQAQSEAEAEAILAEMSRVK